MTTADPQFEGVYGPYTITDIDRRDVQRYRLALLASGVALTLGLLQWWQVGGAWAWLWVLPLAAGLGLALRWIHIYLKPLHQALQLFWLVGCLGWGALLVVAGPADALAAIQMQPIWILAIGPLFAALAGIGFKSSSASGGQRPSDSPFSCPWHCWDISVACCHPWEAWRF